MMLGERHRPNPPTLQVPPWALHEEDQSNHNSPLSPNTSTSNAQDYYSPIYLQEALNALQRYLPSSQNDAEFLPVVGTPTDSPVDAYSCDHFRMYEFKVKRCARGRSHDWTECPFAHPGEKARRRDPRKYHYSGTACLEFRKGSCKKGDACEYAHGVFECWLHPARYRTQPCKDGAGCRRRVCFFAHSPDQLRVLPYVSPPESPPMSPVTARSSPINKVMASLRDLQLIGSCSPSSLGASGSVFGSPRPGFFSLPATPTQVPVRGGLGFWDRVRLEEEGEEEVVMERVESGRDIRKRMFEKLCMENSLDQVDPDVGWVSDLVK